MPALEGGIEFKEKAERFLECIALICIWAYGFPQNIYFLLEFIFPQGIIILDIKISRGDSLHI